MPLHSSLAPRIAEGSGIACGNAFSPQPSKVLIGPLYTGIIESVSMVNSTFVEGLRDRMAFTPHIVTRRFGIPAMGRLNPTNALYTIQHFRLWLSRLREFQPDIAHYAIGSGWNLEKSLFFLTIARRQGSRVLGHLHSGDFLDFLRCLNQRRKQRAIRDLLRLDGLVVLSEGWRERVTREIGLEPSRVFVVNNPIERDFEESALRLPIERSRPVVLAMGVMEKPKGVFELLEAAAQLNDQLPFELILAGPEREPGIFECVKRRIHELSLEKCVTVAGEIRGEAKLDLFRRASILALPSRFENFPLVVLEAAAAGVAIVTTPVGATPEFFKHDHSALFTSPGDVAGLAEAIRKLLSNEPLRARFAAAARDAFIQKLSRVRVLESMFNVYVQMMAMHRTNHLSAI